MEIKLKNLNHKQAQQDFKILGGLENNFELVKNFENLNNYKQSPQDLKFLGGLENNKFKKFTHEQELEGVNKFIASTIKNRRVPFTPPSAFKLTPPLTVEANSRPPCKEECHKATMGCRLFKSSCYKFKFNLQFFGQERTEPATPRKREKVREEGRVCVSKDLTAATELIVGLMGMLMLGALTWRTLTYLITFSVNFIGDKTLNDDGWLYFVSWEAIQDYFISWLPLGLLIALFSVIVLVCQVGFAFTSEPFKPKFDRLNPISGMKKIISLRSIVELLKGLLKASLFAIVIYTAIKNYLPETSKTMQMPLAIGGSVFWDMLWTLAMRLAAMLLVMACADYLYQKWEFERSIKMSKQEIKEEYKQMEGDPQVKSKIRQKQREMAKQRMMADVPKSDVVITNPTHLAIALAYERELMSAPQVIAKGQDYLALQIRKIAEENNIPVIENKPLAWALYEQVEVGEEIPADLYRGVAEILAMVYKLKAK